MAYNIFNTSQFKICISILDNESTIVTSDNSTIFSQKRQFSEEIPKWKINQKPVAYVQQIIMKSMVYPYKKDDLVRTDAFRGPLASAFKLHLEDLTVFQDAKRYKMLQLLTTKS